MKALGWIIILIELLSYSFRSSLISEPLILPIAIVDFAFIIAGASFIIADRIKPVIKKDKKD